MIEFIDFGEVIPGLVITSFSPEMQRMYNACQDNENFEIIELRKKEICEIIIADCLNDQVPTRNKFGIKTRERIGIVYNPAENRPYDVRVLRKDFPITMHQNYVNKDEPKSICLYFESWSYIERSWTPQQFLKRILWWLEKISKGELHGVDQPLEPFYLSTGYELIVPPDFSELQKDKNLVFQIFEIKKPRINKMILKGHFILKSSTMASSFNYDCLTISVSPILHGVVEHPAYNLGDLYDQFTRRSFDIYNELRNAIVSFVTSEGVLRNSQNHVILVVEVPLCRVTDSKPEEIKLICFQIMSNIAMLGEACNALVNGMNGKSYNDTLHKNSIANDSWREIQIIPIDIIKSLSSDFALQASGIVDESCSFYGIIAGVGALGSTIADIWSKESWGNWTFIDDDYILPHNIVRHIARDVNIGMSKVEVVKIFSDSNYSPNYKKTKIIIDKANNFNNSEIVNTFRSSNLFIDISTTVEVPRDISDKDFIPRSASLFITPSGRSSILLMEDVNKTIQLDFIEAQYYRAIMNNSWGENHLYENNGSLRVGAGCSDKSFVISQELISLHAAILARQTRYAVNKDDAVIKIWEYEDSNGELIHYNIEVQRVIVEKRGTWMIKSDYGFVNKVSDIRKSKFPNETGGVLVGYIDQKIKTIYIVDALNAPEDSKSDPSSFVRGTRNLEERIEDIKKRTNNVVGYIGEWHSHPKYSSTRMSSDDMKLLQYLSANMKADGLPVIMVIVGDSDLNVIVKED